jgi:hypothetical protein
MGTQDSFSRTPNTILTSCLSTITKNIFSQLRILMVRGKEQFLSVKPA